jgi:hypothetical protein
MATKTTTHEPGQIFTLAPTEPKIAGLDFEADESNPLFDERANLKPTEGWVRNLKSVWLREKARDPKTAVCNVTPVLLRHQVDAEGARTGILEVVEGRQRIIGARFLETNDPECAGIRIQAMINPSDEEDDGLAAASVIIANVRVDDDPVTKAIKTERYVLALSVDAQGNAAAEPTEAAIQKAAVDFGVSDTTVRNRIKLLRQVPTPVQAMVREGRLGMVQALSLVSRPEEEQVKMAEEMAAAGVTAEEAKRLARAPRTPAGGDGADGGGDSDPNTDNGLTLAEVRKILALHADDVEGKGEAKGRTLAPEVEMALQAVAGGVPLSKVKGLRQLFDRVKKGEKPGAAKKAKEEAEAKAKAEAAKKAEEEAKAKAAEAKKAEAEAKKAKKDAAKAKKGGGKK